MNVDQYIYDLVPRRNDLLTEMEEYANLNNVPIMELNGMETMLQILKIKNPSSILEIGTAIGYSALRMAYTIPRATIITLERDVERIKVARSYITKADMEQRVLIIEGDALENSQVIAQQAPFDCLFIDAAKGQYRRFFDMYEKFVAPGGIIVSDNVLFKGLVAQSVSDIHNRRTKHLVDKIKKYNEWLMNHPNYKTVILPVGDGVAISIKQEAKS